MNQHSQKFSLYVRNTASPNGSHITNDGSSCEEKDSQLTSGEVRDWMAYIQDHVDAASEFLVTPVGIPSRAKTTTGHCIVLRVHRHPDQTEVYTDVRKAAHSAHMMTVDLGWTVHAEFLPFTGRQPIPLLNDEAAQVVRAINDKDLTTLSEYRQSRS